MQGEHFKINNYGRNKTDTTHFKYLQKLHCAGCDGGGQHQGQLNLTVKRLHVIIL